MLTPDIRQRVQDNLNRNDPGIATKINGWINDTKRRIEMRLNLDYMRAATQLTATNSDPSPDLPARMKSPFLVMVRKTAPSGQEELTWTRLSRLSEMEVLAVEVYDDASTITSGAPLGYTIEETTITIHPKPKSGETYTIALGFWQFSDLWTFDDDEEPYLAMFAWQAIIDGASSLGFAFTGELSDEGTWSEKFEKRSYPEFLKNEAARALEGELSLRPSTGAADRRPTASWGFNQV